MTNLSVIIPCYNEEKNISNLVDRLEKTIQAVNETVEIILVNDGSTDQTKKIILDEVRRCENVVFVDHAVNKGIVSAWKSGASVAKGEYIVIMDADMQYAPEDIEKLYAVKEKADIIQGVRQIDQQVGWFRCFLSRGFATFLNTIFNCNYHDIKSGFLLCKKNVFSEILNENVGYRYYQHFIGVAALALGYTIFEIPVTFGVRRQGDSFIRFPFLFGLKALLDIPKAFWQFRFKKKGT